jgi:hypothetical protein
MWQLGGALLLTLAMTGGVLAYLHLNAEYAASRSEMGKLRREVGLWRNERFRRDDVTNRNLAAHALLREVDANNRAAMDNSLDRLAEHK